MSEPTWSDRKLESEIRALKIECEKRAFELDKAQAENRRLRGALEEILYDGWRWSSTERFAEVARAALSEQEDEND